MTKTLFSSPAIEWAIFLAATLWRNEKSFYEMEKHIFPTELDRGRVAKMIMA